jgi:hypothetical protein
MTTILVALNAIDIFTSMQFQIDSIVVNSSIVEFLLIFETCATQNFTILCSIFSSHQNYHVFLPSKRNLRNIVGVLYIQSIGVVKTPDRRTEVFICIGDHSLKFPPFIGSQG